MPTIYKAEVVSYLIHYKPKDLEKLLENAIKKDEKLKEFGNQITIELKRIISDEELKQEEINRLENRLNQLRNN